MSAFQPLFELCTGRTLVLTPNQRLGRQVQTQYAQMMQEKGHSAWVSLHVSSWSIWVQEQWSAFVSASVGVSSDTPLFLMSASQEESIWLEVLQQDEAASELFDVRATAKECRRAWNTLVQWGESLNKDRGFEPAFIRWQGAFQRYCQQKSLIDGASAAEKLVEAFGQGLLIPPPAVVMVAFDDVTPQMTRVLSALNTRGVESRHWSPVVANEFTSRVAVKDSKSEIVAAARWAAALVEKEKVEQEKHVRIGIVFPQLLNQRAQVERIFMDVFEPQYKLPGAQRHAPPFNISAGVSLSACPIIATALLVMKLNYRDIDIETIEKVLHSPFIGRLDEIPSRALLFETLKEQGLTITMAGLRSAVGEYGVVIKNDENNEGQKQALLPDLYRRLHQWLACSRSQPKQQAPSEWGRFICEQWQALGWPGNRSLDTLEYQQVEVWQKAITELNQYDYLFPSVALSQAISLIDRIAFDTQFQPQTMDSPVQVLGLFEAAGSVFDYVWVANLDSDTWPSPVKPNALLPIALQKEKRMPLASPEKELDLAQRITQRFEQSCRQLIVSYSLADGDRAMSVSPIVEPYPGVTMESLLCGGAEPYANLLLEHKKIECLALDELFPVENPLEIRGGTQILKDQAACPFRAFARHRLAAKNREEFKPGIDASFKGALVHRVLDLVWKRVKNHNALIRLSAQTLSSVVQDSIGSSLNELDRHSRIGPRLRQIEAARVHNIVSAWLELEKGRVPFDVATREAKQTINLAGLPVNLRLDRVDTLDDGQSKLVLDYKTSKVEVRSWAGERPDEPQVPLYAVANKDSVAGVAFGQLHFDGVEIKGVSESDGIAPGLSIPDALAKLDLPATWPEIIQHWETVLENLAAEFLRGEADVSPKNALTTCRYCDLQSLCRIKSQETNSPHLNSQPLRSKHFNSKRFNSKESGDVS